MTGQTHVVADLVSQGKSTAKMLGLPLYDHRFGARSLAALEGVHPYAVAIASLAICLCSYDGTVLPQGGLRTPEAAADYMRRGTSRTKNSRHLRQSDGYGHAIDLIPLKPGRGIDWNDLVPFIAMAEAVRTASALLRIPVRQGADFDMNGTLGDNDTFDWAHFELPDTRYLQRARELMREAREALGL